MLTCNHDHSHCTLHEQSHCAGFRGPDNGRSLALRKGGKIRNAVRNGLHKPVQRSQNSPQHTDSRTSFKDHADDKLPLTWISLPLDLKNQNLTDEQYPCPTTQLLI